MLYHRIVAPTTGVLEWAGGGDGDSVSFDLLFTGVESMSAPDIQQLSKARDEKRSTRDGIRCVHT